MWDPVASGSGRERRGRGRLGPPPGPRESAAAAEKRGGPEQNAGEGKPSRAEETAGRLGRKPGRGNEILFFFLNKFPNKF